METTMGKAIGSIVEPAQRPWDLAEICNRLAGGEALSQIAQQYGKSKQALWKWLNSNEEAFFSLSCSLCPCRVTPLF